MKDFDTLSEAMNALREDGYTEDFNLTQDCLVCSNGAYKMFANEFNIDRFYRFEGMSDPGDSSILYAISSDIHNIKGMMVNAYGIYSNAATNEMIEKLRTH